MDSRPRHGGTAAAAVALIVALGGAAPAGDWPQWRGPARDGVAAGIPAPASWPAKLTRVWSVPVGEGHSSPVVAGDRLFVHTREGDAETLRAMKLADGSALWRESWPVSYQMNPAATAHGKGPKATPVVADGILVTAGIAGSLSAFDAATGRPLWRRDFAASYKATSPLYGTSASPLVDRGLVIWHAGGHHAGALSAFDLKTGETRWSLAGDGPGYASPIAADLAGRRQIVTQTDQRIVGVAADTGGLLWSLPFTTPWDQNVVTPIVMDGLLIVSGLEQGTRAYAVAAVEGKADALAPREVWSRKDPSFYMSTPVPAAGKLFGLSHLKSGQIVCFDPKTGEILRGGTGRDAEQAALVAIGDSVLALTDGGELIVISATGKDLAPVARYRVAESPTWAHPVPTATGILIKDRTTLTLWSWSS